MEELLLVMELSRILAPGRILKRRRRPRMSAPAA